MSALSTTLLSLWLLSAAPAPISEGVAGGEAPSCRSILTFSTPLGTIEIELLERADPVAFRRLVRLARGPTFHPDLQAADRPPVGFYEGLAFDFTRPHVEIATETRRPPELFSLETRIDAEALGLDRDLVEDAAEAMSVLQQELLPEFVSKKKRGRITPQLEEWLEEWYARQEPDFLVGVSRKRINEALGYAYHSGLESVPPERGAVALWPESPSRSSARLTIFLADLPQRAGRWLVVGRVLRGLEVADSISSQPLVPGAGARWLKPLQPITIDQTHFECRPSPEPDGSQPMEENHGVP